MRVLLSIPSLMPGGAERQLAELAVGLSARGHAVLVVALGQGGPLEKALGQAQLKVLGKQGRWDNLRVALRLAELLRSFQAQAHYAFLPTPCVLGALLKPLAPSARLVMGVRATPVRHAAYEHGLAGCSIETLERLLARQADLVIANSEAGRRACLERRFPVERTVVVPNGIDTARCRPDRSLGLPLRQAWGIAPETPLIGLVARLDPMKDHANFLTAATLLLRQRPDARFVCVGGGPEGYAAALRGQAESLGLADRLTWAGLRPDMPEVYNALDILCLSSAYGEGFPNVLGEAMACGVPCCATDVGDAALVLGETGVIVPKGDSEALTAGLVALLDRLDKEGRDLRMACRERIVDRYSVERMVADTEALLMRLIDEVQP